MLHMPTAARWSAEPRFLESLGRWRWFREAVPDLLRRLASPGPVDRLPTVDIDALARAFWGWAAALDANVAFEALDPVDHAHFECGVLLARCLTERPLGGLGDDRAVEVRALTATALTLLEAWRLALQAPPLEPSVDPATDPRWAGYVENVVEDASAAIAFLDLFTGCEPVWRSPTIESERPPLRRALERRRQS